MGLRPTYGNENVSVSNRSSPGPTLSFVIPSAGMSLRPTYEDENVSVQ